MGVDSTLYDQVLDMTCALGLVPARFKGLQGLDLYFAMARGHKDAQALDMSKYFNTNYHYLVRPACPSAALACLCASSATLAHIGMAAMILGAEVRLVRESCAWRRGCGVKRGSVQVPEISAAMEPRLDASAVVEKVKRAQAAVGAARAVPMLVGPITMARLASLDGTTVPQVVAKLQPLFEDLLKQLAQMKVRAHTPHPMQ